MKSNPSTTEKNRLTASVATTVLVKISFAACICCSPSSLPHTTDPPTAIINPRPKTSDHKGTERLTAASASAPA